MKLDEGDSLVNVAICTKATTCCCRRASGKAIRFPVTMFACSWAAIPPASAA